jgi:hypothetical protein
MPDFELSLPGPSLAAALRALPLEAPGRSALPLLVARAASLAPPRSRPARRGWGARSAIAALLLVALLLPFWQGQRPPSPAGAGDGSAELANLIASSQNYERLIAASGNDVADSATVLDLRMGKDERLQQIDAELARPDLSDGERLLFWRARVDTLADIARLESARRWYAANGQAFEPVLVATY